MTMPDPLTLRDQLADVECARCCGEGKLYHQGFRENGENVVGCPDCAGTGRSPARVTRCQRCDNLTRFGCLCGSCIADDMDFDEDDSDPEGPAFECAGYYPEPAGEFYCPLWGSEECDWECPRS